MENLTAQYTLSGWVLSLAVEAVSAELEDGFDRPDRSGKSALRLAILFWFY
jgi:hypothetical protein